VDTATAIPKLGDVHLLRDDGVPRIGASFQIARPPRKHIEWNSGDWDIVVREQSSRVVVRGPSIETDYSCALHLCANNLQLGLDLVSTTIGTHLVVSDFEDEQLVWWPTPDGLTIRHVFVASSTFDASLTGTVRDKDGNVVPPTVEPGLPWHESFRYYRLSQATTDLFDGYRNAYLALESLLSDIAPQRFKLTGAPAESEGKWFQRALSAADAQYNLAQWLPAGVADPVTYLFRNLYQGTRSALSHAKTGRPVLLPQTAADRANVLSSLKETLAIYQGIAAARLGVRWRGASLASHASASMLRAVFGDLEMFVSDDETPFDKSETKLNPAGGQLRRLVADSSFQLVSDTESRQLWASSTSGLAELPFIRRVVASIDGAPASVSVLPERLFVQGASRFEAEIGVRILSARDPRSEYSY